VRAYSERLAWNSGGAVTVTYTVPVGHRAVLKWLLAWNGNNSPANLSVTLNGAGVYVVPVPGSNGEVSRELMVVAYAGERLGFIQYSTQGSFVASGYVFTDP
jgi:hypothetical protein